MSTPASAMWSSTPVSFPSLDTPAPGDIGPTAQQLHPPANHRTKRNRPIVHDPHPTSTFHLHTPTTTQTTHPTHPQPHQPHPARPPSRPLFDPASGSAAARSSAGAPPTATPRSSLTPLHPGPLRAAARAALAQHRYTTAIFYADKLCSLAVQPGGLGARGEVGGGVGGLPPLGRVLLLCRCYHGNGEYRRAIHALRTRTAVCPPHTVANTGHDMDDVWQYIHSADDAHDDDDDDRADNDNNDADADDDDDSSKENQRSHTNTSMTDTDKQGRRPPSTGSAVSAVAVRARLVLECWLLLSTCLFRCRDYEDALLTLGADDTAAQHALHRLHDALHGGGGGGRSAVLLAAVASQRGDVYSQQQNRAKASAWYRQALRYDARAVDAFDRLVDGRMLAHEAERRMLDELDYGGCEWLRLVYWNKVQQYDASAATTTAIAAATSAAQPLQAALATPSTAQRSPGQEGGVAGRLATLSAQCGLHDNVELYTALVQQLHQRYDTAAALALSSRLLTLDPYSPHLLPLHLLLLTATRNTSHLFYISHQLSSSLPSSPLSLYAIALYYYSVRRLDLARRFLSRCSALDPLLPLPWLAFGHCWAEEDESDQALAAYRTAARLFEGSHLPPLCLAMEHARTGNTALAAQLLHAAHALQPTDPLTHNELGTLAYHAHDYHRAAEHFRHALALTSSAAAAASTGGGGDVVVASAWSITACNLGHALRKVRAYGAALAAYRQALAPPHGGAAAGLHLSVVGVSQVTVGGQGGAGLGGGGGGGGDAGGWWYVVRCIAFVYHLMGDLDAAILHYHRALAVRPRDTMTSDLLNRALQETVDRTISGGDMERL